ncbi:MAG TPA: DUF559 domain-containing protein [Fimbriimonadaceae bacterium]|nr:DUF559 domain-containing protein [Fimbriimonadaceae bacterium]
MRKNSRNHSLEANLTARKLRAEMSLREKILWEHLRRKNLGYTFKRQVPVGPYILDFYCPSANLAVELDGEAHNLRKIRDRIRDEAVGKAGVLTMRIPDEDLYQRLEATLKRIKAACDERVRK